MSNNKEQKKITLKEASELALKSNAKQEKAMEEYLQNEMDSTPPKALREEELWEELQVEVMEDYLSDARFGEKLITEEDRKKHLEIMRNHYDKLISFINKLLKQDRERIINRIVGLVKNTPEEVAELNKDLPSPLQEQAYHNAVGYIKAYQDIMQILDEEQL